MAPAPTGTSPVGEDDVAVGEAVGATEETLGWATGELAVGVGWPVQPASNAPVSSQPAAVRARNAQAFFQTRIQSTDIDGRLFCFFTVDFFTPEPGLTSGLLTRYVSQSELSRLTTRL